MEKWLNSSPSQGDIHGFESRWGHHSELNTKPFYNNGTLLGITFDLTNAINKWKDRRK